MIGKMRHKVSVYEVVLGENNGFEEPVVNEVLRFQTWATIKQLSREAAIRQQMDIETEQFTVLIRSAVDTRTVTKNDRLVWNGEKYNILTSPTKIDLEHREYYQFTIGKEK